MASLEYLRWKVSILQAQAGADEDDLEAQLMYSYALADLCQALNEEHVAFYGEYRLSFESHAQNKWFTAKGCAPHSPDDHIISVLALSYFMLSAAPLPWLLLPSTGDRYCLSTKWSDRGDQIDLFHWPYRHAFSCVFEAESGLEKLETIIGELSTTQLCAAYLLNEDYEDWVQFRWQGSETSWDL